MKTNSMKAASVFNLDAIVILSIQVEALNKKIDVMQCDANRVGMINSECLPFDSSTKNEQVNFMDLKITLIAITIMQVGGTIQISVEVVKKIKGHNPSEFSATLSAREETKP
ncbi:Aspartic peptidase [Gossypium australe]|uniref:Aspartic peptidase n=1 Tax=Gossypium australe TaxID=47621 RepID=A0A5B6VW93_9ROSI|nr:Aspartic peptidase [Gossypium australe]